MIMKRVTAGLAAALLLGGGSPLHNADWPHYGGQYDEAGYAALAAAGPRC